ERSDGGAQFVESRGGGGQMRGTCTGGGGSSRRTHSRGCRHVDRGAWRRGLRRRGGGCGRRREAIDRRIAGLLIDTGIEIPAQQRGRRLGKRLQRHGRSMSERENGLQGSARVQVVADGLAGASWLSMRVSASRAFLKNHTLNHMTIGAEIAAAISTR